MANPRTIARLQSRIRERAAYCLQFEISDPRAGFITITHVELSSDLSVGKIHYSVLGTEQEKNKAAHMLVSAAGYIQRQIARVLEMRRIPRLVWIYDDSVEKAADLDLLIREARERDRAINPHAHEEPESLGSSDASASQAGVADDGADDVDDDGADDGDDAERDDDVDGHTEDEPHADDRDEADPDEESGGGTAQSKMQP